jgi:MFS family permease
MSTSENKAIYPLIVGEFFVFLIVGIPLPVLPRFVHNTLGYSPAVAGFVIGVHFLATVLMRCPTGRISDIWGGKRTMVAGAFAASASGVSYFLAALPGMPAEFILPCIIAGRVCLGIGHSMVGTGMLIWGFGLLGARHAGRVIAWSGISMYAGISCGAPLGIMLHEAGGIAGIGAASCLLPLCAALILLRRPETEGGGTRKPSVRQGGVLKRTLRPGVCLALHGVGNAAVTAFVPLYFFSEGWGHAGIALTLFGCAFILARVLCGELPDRTDGTRLTLVFLAVEAAGLVLLGAAPFLPAALAGVFLTGFGCSLIYPSIGVDLVRSVPSKARGSAVAWFTAFQDVSFGVTGPLTGMLIPLFGYPSVFYAASGCAALAFLITLLTGKGTKTGDEADTAGSPKE